MAAAEHRSTSRYLMRVPLRFQLVARYSKKEQVVESLNLSLYGASFLTDLPVREGQGVKLWVRMPGQIVNRREAEWCITGRVTHVGRPHITGGRFAVGVQFLYYETADSEEMPSYAAQALGEAKTRILPHPLRPAE